jgi:hypothetical protein
VGWACVGERRVQRGRRCDGRQPVLTHDFCSWIRLVDSARGCGSWIRLVDSARGCDSRRPEPSGSSGQQLTRRG